MTTKKIREKYRNLGANAYYDGNSSVIDSSYSILEGQSFLEGYANAEKGERGSIQTEIDSKATAAVTSLPSPIPRLQVTTKIAIPLDVLTEIHSIATDRQEVAIANLETYLQLIVDDAYNIGLEQGRTKVKKLTEEEYDEIIKL